MTTAQIITQDPDIHGGVPVFTGTRVPVKSLIDHLKAGESLDYFLEGFPSVSRQQAIAFLEIALASVSKESRPEPSDDKPSLPLVVKEIES